MIKLPVVMNTLVILPLCLQDAHDVPGRKSRIESTERSKSIGKRESAC